MTLVSQRQSHGRYSHNGFTLIEMAVVLFIFGLLIAGLLGPLETQLEARDRAQTIESMEQILEALYGYAITNGRLPCPDTNGDGLSDVDTNGDGLPGPAFSDPTANTANCLGGGFTNGEGFLPWAELGVAAGDAWGNRFRYRVRFPQYTWPETDGICDGNTVQEEFDLCTTGDISIISRGDDPATTPAVEGKAVLNVANNLPAIVLSHGRNGFGAVSINGAIRPAPLPTSDEAENTDGDVTFNSRGYSSASAACADDTDESTALCEFDDIVRWVSPALLNNRMVVAGRLP